MPVRIWGAGGAGGKVTIDGIDVKDGLKLTKGTYTSNKIGTFLYEDGTTVTDFNKKTSFKYKNEWYVFTESSSILCKFDFETKRLVKISDTFPFTSVNNACANDTYIYVNDGSSIYRYDGNEWTIIGTSPSSCIHMIIYKDNIYYIARRYNSSYGNYYITLYVLIDGTWTIVGNFGVEYSSSTNFSLYSSAAVGEDGLHFLSKRSHYIFNDDGITTTDQYSDVFYFKKGIAVISSNGELHYFGGYYDPSDSSNLGAGYEPRHLIWKNNAWEDGLNIYTYFTNGCAFEFNNDFYIAINTMSSNTTESYNDDIDIIFCKIPYYLN